MIVQRYRLKGGEPTQAFRKYFDELDTAIDNVLVPAFDTAGLLLDATKYDEAGLEGSLRLASISDFNTLVANSQQVRKPVFDLTQDDAEARGFVWQTQKKSIDSFKETFDVLAQRVETMTADDKPAISVS
jgi:hypothetical protein